MTKLLLTLFLVHAPVPKQPVEPIQLTGLWAMTVETSESIQFLWFAFEKDGTLTHGTLYYRYMFAPPEFATPIYKGKYSLDGDKLLFCSEDEEARDEVGDYECILTPTKRGYTAKLKYRDKRNPTFQHYADIELLRMTFK